MKKAIFSALLALLLLCPLLLPLSASAGGDFTVSRAFGDNMILQRDQKAAVWGWSESAGATVTVTFGSDISATGTVSAAGEWTVYLPAMPASATPRDLTVKMNGKETVFHNVLVGDVWFISGQSNAQLPLSYSTVKAVYPNLDKEYSDDSITRFFYQGEFVVNKNRSLMKTVQKDVLESPWSKWMKETDPGFDTSAIGYFFAKKVAKETGVPIGVVCIAYNGAPMTTLMPQESCTKLGITETPYDKDIYPIAGAYNALAAPFIKMGIKGMLFYQGEGDQFDPEGVYEEKLLEYVSAMRQRFGVNFPFYFVQLSSHEGGESSAWTGIGRMRTRQYDLLSEIPNSGMVVSMDVGAREGTADWAHPGEKQPVAERLAALALARDYKIGKEANVTSPIPVSARVTEEGIEIKFKNVGDGLKKLGSADTIYGFAIKRNRTQNTQYEATATIISKDTILVTTTKIRNFRDTTVIYGENLRAFIDHENKAFIANLGSASGLPVPAFRMVAENMDTAEPDTPETEDPLPETSGAATETEPAATPASTPETADMGTTPEEETTPPAEQTAEETDPSGAVDTAKETSGGDDTPAENFPAGVILCIVAAVIAAGGAVTAVLLRKKKQ